MLVGITGKAGAGKDTAADYLVDKYGFVKISFASTLKRMMAEAGLPEPANRDDKEAIVPGFTFSWREAAQLLGTEWGRSLDPDMWVKLTLRGLDPQKNYVISDVRFENEADAVRANGILVHLVGRQVDLGSNAGHASEAGIVEKLLDVRIENRDSIENLFRRIDWVYDLASSRVCST